MVNIKKDLFKKWIFTDKWEFLAPIGKKLGNLVMQASQAGISTLNSSLANVCAQSCLTLCDPMDYNPPGSLPMGFSRQEYWDGLPFLPPRDLPNSGIKPTSLVSPALAGGVFTTGATGQMTSHGFSTQHPSNLILGPLHSFIPPAWHPGIEAVAPASGRVLGEGFKSPPAT